jgi:phosphocarrier protein
MGLMMLAAGPGTEISISSDGREAEAGLASLVTLVNSRFDEE